MIYKARKSGRTYELMIREVYRVMFVKQLELEKDKLERELENIKQRMERSHAANRDLEYKCQALTEAAELLTDQLDTPLERTLAYQNYLFISEQNAELRKQIIALSDTPDNDTIQMAKNAALEVDLARANKRLEAWTALGKSISDTEKGLEAILRLPKSIHRELTVLHLVVNIERKTREAAELYRAQQGQKPAKTAGASA